MNNREAFEAWAEPELYALDKREGSDIYRNVITRNAWIGWNAALASQAAELSSNPLQLELEPYAYDVPTQDGTELAYAIYFTKYNNPLPEGAIPLYASQQESQLPDISALKRIAKELKTYIPEADEYKGKFIHKVWAKEIESALPPAPMNEVNKPEGDKK